MKGLQWNLYNYDGHIGTDRFVHYREVVLFQRQNMYCHYVGVSESVLYTEVSFIQSVLYQRFHCIRTNLL